MASKYCNVYGCLNNNASKDLKFFTAPREKETRLKWLKLIGREDLINKTAHYIYVCEIHFNEQDIKVFPTRKTLQKRCPPCLHLPSPTERQYKEQDKETQTEIHTIDSSSQTVFINEDSSTQTPDYTTHQETGTSYQKTHASDQGSITLSQENNMSKTSEIKIQTSAKLSADTPRIMKLKAEVFSLKKQLKMSQKKMTKKSQKEMFIKLCDQLLSNNLAEVVKAHISLKSSHQGNRYTLAYKMFCSSIFNVSPKAYRLLGKTLSLPSRVTLNKNFPRSPPKKNDDLMAALNLKVNNMYEREKHCSD